MTGSIKSLQATVFKSLQATVLSTILLSTGCQTLTTQSQSAPTLPEEIVMVEVRPLAGKPKRSEVKLTKDLRLQNVVDDSKARFRNKKVYIVRVSPKTGRPHKLTAEFDTSRRRIRMETDYAIQPGDRIVVEQDPSTGIERAVMSMMGRS